MVQNSNQCGPAETVIWVTVGVIVLVLIVLGLMRMFRSPGGVNDDWGSRSGCRSNRNTYNAVEVSLQQKYHKSGDEGADKDETLRKNVMHATTSYRNSKIEGHGQRPMKFFDMVNGAPKHKELSFKTLPTTTITEDYMDDASDFKHR